MRSVILLLAFATIYAQNSTPNACSCLCCPIGDDGVPACGIYGSFPLDDCSQCTADNAVLLCPQYLPDKCTATSSYTVDNDCGASDPNDDWAGDWVIDPCSSCLLDEKNQPLGDCIPCCDASFCDCIYGTVTITDLGVQSFDGTEIKQLEVLASGTSSQTSTNIGNETGFLGTTATVTIQDTYDLIKHGDSMQLKSRSSLSCNVNATRNPPQTSILKLVLLLVGVGVAALACIIFCCCNPCKKKKQDEKLLAEGQGQEGIPYNQAQQVGGINYTGGTSNP